MKRFLFIISCTAMLASCGGKKDEKKGGSTSKRPVHEKPATSGPDGELTKWLSNKRFVSTKKDPKYDTWDKMQLRADGSCTDRGGASATWIIKNGKLVLQSVINITSEIEKRAEDTLVMKGLAKDDVYYLAPL